jgi:hypothetical protein
MLGGLTTEGNSRKSRLVLPVKSNDCASKLPTPTYHEQFAEFDTI